ncbi:Zn(2)-C6 fungal-type DNA-binding domain [Phaffia rhodozyma]|uniref:Zn(2)-C6 fungal-type DNA-binding domain n=1 Tax=Phaffia rhodozyma TaxID=264483 RepID=A0A0F7SIE9_PHARH|nr:Zn(2)-C6 fungal-type DNA-binding domain [Phaffia rhodozyma]
MDPSNAKRPRSEDPDEDGDDQQMDTRSDHVPAENDLSTGGGAGASDEAKASIADKSAKPIDSLSSVIQVGMPGAGGSGSANGKINRTVQACARCRSQKMKCVRELGPDGTSTNTTPCRGCLSSGIICVYEAPKRRPRASAPVTTTPTTTTSATTAASTPANSHGEAELSLRRSVLPPITLSDPQPFRTVPSSTSNLGTPNLTSSNINPVITASSPSSASSRPADPVTNQHRPINTLTSSSSSATAVPSISTLFPTQPTYGLEHRVFSLEEQVAELKRSLHSLLVSSSSSSHPATHPHQAINGSIPPPGPSSSIFASFSPNAGTAQPSPNHPGVSYSHRHQQQHHQHPSTHPQHPSQTGRGSRSPTHQTYPSSFVRHSSHSNSDGTPPAPATVIVSGSKENPKFGQAVEKRETLPGLTELMDKTRSDGWMYGEHDPIDNKTPRAPDEGDLVDRGIISEEEARQAIEFYISDLALHTPSIPFLPSPFTRDHMKAIRRSSPLLFDVTVTVSVRALNKKTYLLGVKAVRRAIGRFVEACGEGVGMEDVRAMVIFSVWHCDFLVHAFALQVANSLHFPRAMAHYTSLQDAHSKEGIFLLEISRLYSILYIHDHIFQVLNGNPPLMRDSMTAAWKECMRLSTDITGVDSYILAYLSLSDRLEDVYNKLILPEQPGLVIETVTRIETSRKLFASFVEWNVAHQAQHNLSVSDVSYLQAHLLAHLNLTHLSTFTAFCLFDRKPSIHNRITALPLFFSTLLVFSPIMHNMTDWTSIMSYPEGAYQVSEATDKADILLTMLLQRWKERPMLSYTLDIHTSMIGLSIVHLLGRIFCVPSTISDEEPAIHHKLINRLMTTLDTLRTFEFDTRDCLLGSILEDLDAGARTRNKVSAGWEQLRKRRWGRDMWVKIVPKSIPEQRQP